MAELISLWPGTRTGLGLRTGSLLVLELALELALELELSEE
jgi:hypothetical protein